MPTSSFEVRHEDKCIHTVNFKTQPRIDQYEFKIMLQNAKSSHLKMILNLQQNCKTICYQAQLQNMIVQITYLTK